MEELYPELGVIANLSPFEVRAPASPKMAVKRIERVGIDVFRNTSFLVNEAAKVGGGSNVSNGAGWCVSVAFEFVRERVNVWSSDSAAQARQCLGRGEELL
jgi:hypothetical protein